MEPEPIGALIEKLSVGRRPFEILRQHLHLAIPDARIFKLRIYSSPETGALVMDAKKAGKGSGPVAREQFNRVTSIDQIFRRDAHTEQAENTSLEGDVPLTVNGGRIPVGREHFSEIRRAVGFRLDAGRNSADRSRSRHP